MTNCFALLSVSVVKITKDEEQTLVYGHIAKYLLNYVEMSVPIESNVL